MTANEMMFIDPHIHMTSRTTYDYMVMRQYGIVAVIEPSFWVGPAGAFKQKVTVSLKSLPNKSFKSPQI